MVIVVNVRCNLHYIWGSSTYTVELSESFNLVPFFQPWSCSTELLQGELLPILNLWWKIWFAIKFNVFFGCYFWELPASFWKFYAPIYYWWPGLNGLRSAALITEQSNLRPVDMQKAGTDLSFMAPQVELSVKPADVTWCITQDKFFEAESIKEHALFTESMWFMELPSLMGGAMEAEEEVIRNFL